MTGPNDHAGRGDAVARLTEANRTARRRHRNKQCGWCEQRLDRIAVHGCASIYSGSECWWGPTIAAHGLDEAVRLSNERRSTRQALSDAQEGRTP